jgi:hypothetical protein
MNLSSRYDKVGELELTNSNPTLAVPNISRCCLVFLLLVLDLKVLSLFSNLRIHDDPNDKGKISLGYIQLYKFYGL